MELNDLVGNILQQLEELPRQHRQKRNYVIDELEFEINVSEITDVDGRVNIAIVNLGTRGQSVNSHKIKLKLKPKPIRQNR